MKIRKHGVRAILSAEGTVDLMFLMSLKAKYSTYKEVRKGRITYNVIDKEFFLYNVNTEEMTISINQLARVMNSMLTNGIRINTSEDKYDRSNLVPIHATVNKGMSLRDDLQKDYYAYLQREQNIYLCNMQTGKGKTGSSIISLLSMPNPNRITIVVRSSYAQIWVEALSKFSNITEDKIHSVVGRKKLLELANDSSDILRGKDVVIITSGTLRDYIGDYYAGNNDVSISPSEIIRSIGSEYVILDEGHESFNLVYRTVLALEAPKTLILTASYTSVNDGKKLTIFKDLLVPEDLRLPDAEFDKYVNVVFCRYRFNDMTKIKYSNSSLGYYSHITLEESILRVSEIYNNYFKLICYLMDTYWISKYRCLILFSRRDMVIAFYRFLKKYKKYDKKRIAMYMQESEDSALKADIIISTEKSCGTGKDIENNQTTINTISSKSEYMGIQASGRNRKMNNVEQYYITLWTGSIPSQETYMKSNSELFKSRAKKIMVDYYADGV